MLDTGADALADAFVALLFGLLVGSFANVVIHRWPRGESVVTPPSRCPRCGARIRPWQNVPVISWLALRGRCAACEAPISARYPLVEAVMGVLFGAATLAFGVSPLLPFLLAFVFAMVVLALIDWDVQLLPDVITLPGIALGVASSFAPGAIVSWRLSLLAAALGYVSFWAIATTYLRTRGIEGLGQGDWKLAAMLGAFLGPERLMLVVLLASLSGTVFGLAAALRARATMPSEAAPAADPVEDGAAPVSEPLGQFRLPFGTFLAVAGLATLFVGDPLLAWYRGFFPEA